MTLPMNEGLPVFDAGQLSPTAWVIASIVKILVVFVVVLVIVAFLTLLERKISAWMQDRLGPNRVGPRGLLQPAADGLKNILKEETNPAQAHRIFFVLAPMLSITPAMVTFAIIPFAAPLPTPWGIVPMVLADVPIGILFLLAFSSLGVYGIVMAGWASSNKYALLGGLRAGAQMISYEIAMGMSLLSVFFVIGDVTLPEVVWGQQRMHLWYAIPLSVSFLFFWISAFAETNRLPFDLPEAESELITGYHTEYSSMKFSMFFIAEYAHVLTVSMLMATLFLGGWDIPLWQGDNMLALANGTVIGHEPHWWITLLTFVFFCLKTFFFILVFMLVRWTVPRFRYDQVMDLGWKFMLPCALAIVVVTAGTILVLDESGVEYGLVYGLVLTAVNAVMLAIVVLLLDKGRVLSGSFAMQEKRARARVVAQFQNEESLNTRLGVESNAR
ncbi:MAG TPA: NADH-quinone oxidoreductase subunit NuoH [Longimicrobiaceae bacterium]|nr:NADH-quinone oxidoreductase subunit NuoH [Longimicrobiaceae bacterium]